jgi:hypothetical protein
MPGLLAWRYGFEVAATPGQTSYFAVFEAEFADAAAMTAARASPQGQRVSGQLSPAVAAKAEPCNQVAWCGGDLAGPRTSAWVLEGFVVSVFPGAAVGVVEEAVDRQGPEALVPGEVFGGVREGSAGWARGGSSGVAPGA